MSIMESISLAESETSRLNSEGFIYFEDSELGQAVQDLRSKGFPLKTTPGGLKFCRVKLLEDERVQRALRSFFDTPCLGVYHWYSSDPDQTYMFTKKEGRHPQAIVVHLFAPDTTIVLFGGSQLKMFKTWHAPNGMLVVLNAKLRKAGCQGEEVVLRDGGIVIADTRLGFRTIKGHAVIGIFADKNGEELKEWDLMELTSGVGLEEEVSAMAVSGIDTNFTFS